MALKKTSKAEVKSVRLNPINLAEANVLRIIREQEARGFDFKAVVVDAINRADGSIPEMFTRHDILDVARVAELFNQFADQLIARIRSGEIPLSTGPSDGEASSEAVGTHARNFVRGFMQRSGNLVDMEEDE